MLNNEELSMISGGAIKWTIGLIIGALGAFLAGVLDGYLRPKCN
ncbi:MAG: class IIb bacteriocin, lactobin A/cerein 7B family [bacterium]|nr:class IIb bacteriocin, lactobin A/cerein 7B family [bacterium]